MQCSSGHPVWGTDEQINISLPCFTNLSDLSKSVQTRTKQERSDFLSPVLQQYGAELRIYKFLKNWMAILVISLLQHARAVFKELDSLSAHGTVDPAWKRLILWCKNANRARTWNHLEETHLASFGGICFRELHQRSTATVPVWRGTPASWTEWGTWRHFHNPCNRSGCSNRACSATVVVMADRFPCTRGLALATRQIPLLRLMFFLPST